VETVIVATPRPVAPPAGQPPALQPSARVPGTPPPVTTPGVPPARTPMASDADQPASRRPTLVPQTPARPLQPARHVEARVAQPGDLICSNCQEPNDPTRRFCRRCGTSLAAAPVQVEKRLPWWRRLFGPRKPRHYEAGTRMGSTKPGAPKPKSGLSLPIPLIRKVLAVLIGFGIIGAVVLPDVRSAVLNGGAGFLKGGNGIVDQVRRIFAPTLVIVHPASASATSELKDHEAGKVIDTFSNTDWQSNEPTPTLTVTFAAPIDLAAVYIHNGTANGFVDLRRPAKLQFVFPDGKTSDITLVDDHKPQQFNIEASALKQVEIRVLATSGDAGKPVALSEIEFFMKQ
jgi:hypothetical protein